MDTTIEQQAAMDEALVPYAQRLRIGRSNFCLLSNIKSKESTLQLVYDVLRICPFFKAILVTADVPEIYMDMLHICPRVHGQSFAEPPFKEEILAFIRFLGHSAAIRMLTDGLYHKRNIDYAYLLWEDFVYQVQHKNTKKSNEMYYPRFTKVVIHHFMSKDPSIPRRNKNTQQFGALLPIELTNDEIRNSNAYKEYYAIATGAAPPKPKASARRTRSSSDTSISAPTAAVSPRLAASAKGKQTAKASKAKSLSALSEVAMTEAQQLKLVTKRSMQQTHISQASGSGDDDDADQEVVRDDNKDDEEEGGNDEHEFDEDESDEETRDEESFDPIPQTPENSKYEGNGAEDLSLNVGGEERHIEEEDEL
nr:hypothetical protein [Tanacetum cinerariifolium]